MNIRALISSTLWMWPFVAFFGGYQGMRYITQVELVVMPTVVGLHLNEAIQILSEDRLNVRILAKKEDFDLQEGTILSQMPHQGKMVKPHQSVFLVTSCRPNNARAPKLVGEPKTKAQEEAKKAHRALKVYHFESSYPKDRCIAQSVLPEQEMKDSSLIVYCSEGNTPLRIMPDLKNHKAEECISFFGRLNILVKVVGDKQGTVIDQQPIAGTLIDISKPLVIDVTTEAFPGLPEEVIE